MWRAGRTPGRWHAVSGGERDRAGAAILKAGAQRGRVEVAANEDDLAHPLLSGGPRTAGPAIKRHVDAVEDEAAVLAGEMENAFDAEEIASVGENQRVDPAIELEIVHAVRAADSDAADIFGVFVVVLVKQMRVDCEYVFQIESAHVEHAIERQFAVLRAVNAGKRIETADFVRDRIDPRRRLKIDLFEEDDVGDADLAELSDEDGNPVGLRICQNAVEQRRLA